MNTNKNSYTIIYAAIMVVVVALMLALVSGALKEKQTTNKKIDKKKQILSSLNIIDTKGKDVEKMYDEYIVKGLVINSKGEVLSDSKDKAFEIEVEKELSKPLEKRELPVYIANVDGQTKYIVSLRGTGLWGPIWGYLSFNDDKNTVFGSYFSHEGETPGLGAEIATKHFQNEFIGKKIKNAENKFTSIAVVKHGQTVDGSDYVDGISGGTITSKGVEKMLLNCVGQYESFLKQPTTGGIVK